MKNILSADSMKKMEHFTINEVGVPSLSLMETASRNFYNFLVETIGKNEILKNAIGYIFCGVGNNGADGLCVARFLFNIGASFKVFIIGNKQKATDEWNKQYNICKNIGMEFSELIETENRFVRPSYIVDALFGIGLNRNLEGEFLNAVSIINSLKKLDSSIVFSMDIPSGIDGNTGCVLNQAVLADYTVTNEWIKTGLILNEGPLYSGKIIVKETGILLNPNEKITGFTYEENDISLVNPRKFNDHKSSNGKVLIFGGSPNMPGAAILSSMASFRSGAGMVKVISSKTNKDLIIHELPEAMIGTYDDSDFEYEDYFKDFEWCDVCLIGPGLGQSDQAKNIFIQIYNNFPKTLIIDADGLNILSQKKELFKVRKDKGYKTVITPHPLEFSRLFDLDIKAKYNQNYKKLQELSLEYDYLIVAKDARTIVSCNNNIYFNIDTTAALGTAGAGDVLSGIISAFCAKEKKDIFKAVSLAVYVHSLAGKEACYEFGEKSVKASDVINGIYQVLG